MKKKILSTIIITIVFALSVVSTFFVIFSDVNTLEKTQENLESYTNYLVKIGAYKEDGPVENIKIDGIFIRCTYIDKDGIVIYDNTEDKLENHKSRVEIKEAFEKGTGSSIRMSDTKNKKMVYYAVKTPEGNIFRTSISFDSTKFFKRDNTGLYIIILLVVLTASVILSVRILKVITEPLKELEKVTKKISEGDLHIRVNLNSDDEIGVLGRTFNKMADQLQNKINEVTDRQNRLEAILSSMESGIIAVDEFEKVIAINPYSKRVFSIKEDIIGKNISDYIKDYDINTFLKQNNINEIEIKILSPIERDLKIKQASIGNIQSKIGKVITVQDISDIKRLENMRSQFVANVTHELKTPLTSIKGFAETLKYVKDDKTRIKFLDIINKESERLSRLISDILVLSKIESCPIEENDDFLPGTVLEEVYNIVKNEAMAKNINIIINEKNNIRLNGSKDRFTQVVLNLMENAIKYSEENTQITVNSYEEIDIYVLDVIDSGIGIPMEDIPRIFERFYRVDKSRKRGGTGLGLAIVKHIVKSFGGDVFVQSTLGVGSKFTVKIKNNIN